MNRKKCGILGALRQAMILVGSSCTILLLAASTYGNTLNWTGGGAPNGNWNTSANWGLAGIPGNGDTVIFQGASGLNSTNNIVGLTLGQIKFIAGGFNIYGNPFTLTNSIVATNFTGSINFSNNFTIATADVTLLTSNNITLTLKGNIDGTVGVIKTGSGTVIYNGHLNNTYTGTTQVSDGTLELNVGGVNAFLGPLVIGDPSGFYSPMVEYLQPSEMFDEAPITINSSGTLNLNTFFDTIGTNLTFNGGVVETGGGLLTLSPNCTITAANNQVSHIYGDLNTGSGTLTIQGNGTLEFWANVSGTANIVQNGTLDVIFLGSNTYSGNYTANDSSAIDLASETGLGNFSNKLTLNGNSTVGIDDGDFVTNQTVTCNSTNRTVGAIRAPGNLFHNCQWSANFVFNTDCWIYVLTNNVFKFAATSMSGPAGFVKFGAGTLTLAGTDNSSSYAGNTVVNEGILLLNSANVIRHGNLVIGDGVGGAGADVVRYLSGSCIYGGPGGSTVVINKTGLLDLNGFFDDVGPIYMDGGTITTGAGALALFPPLATLSSGNGASSVYGNLSLSSSNFNTLVVSNDLYINAVISDLSGNTLAKSGPGSLHLIGANTYNGPTVVQQGILLAQNNLALGTTNSGTVVSNGASLELVNVAITNESLTLNGPGFGGIGSFGSLDVESGVSIWAGSITNNVNSSLDSWSSGAELHLNGPINGPGGLELFNEGTGGGTIFFGGVMGNFYTGLTTVDSGCTLVLANLGGVNVQGNLVLAGNASVVRLGNSEVIGNNSDVLVNAGALFDLNGYHETIDTLHGLGTVNFGLNSWLTIGGNNGTSEFDGNFTGIGYTFPDGGYTIGKMGNGTFTIGGNSTYTAGLNHVYFGSLLVNGYQPQIPIVVDPGATLGGSGTVGTIAANGTISPGNSPGILISGSVTFSSSGKFNVEMTGPNPGAGGYDQLNVTGTNTLANATLNVVPAFTTPVAIGQQFVILNNDGVDAITGTFNGLPEGSTFAVGNYKFAISYVGGTGNDVVLTLKTVPGAAVSSAVTAGDGSHGIDPNGCNNLSLVVSNTAGSAMTGVTATLSTTTIGTVITQPYAPYSDIPANATSTNLSPFQISTLPSFICGTPINLQLSVNSSLGSFTMNYTLQTGETAAVPSRYDVSGNVAIPDIGTVDSTNLVSGFIATPLDKVAVSLYITHTLDSNLTNISLIAPDGTTVLLSSANGGSGQNYGSGLTDPSRTTFDDAGGTSITNGTAPFVGTFRPQSPLAAFIDNATPNGYWHLHIADGFAGSLGTLRGWSLFLYGATCSSGSGICDSCMPAITNSIAPGAPVQNGRWLGNLIVASCGAPKTWAGTAAGSLRYNVYSFTNTTPNDACVTVELQSPSNILATAYLYAFNPSIVTSNYLGDAGNSTHGGTTSFSCSVPAGVWFQVVVSEVTAGTGRDPYTLQLSGLPCPPPTLNIQSVAPSQARIYWDTSAGGYQLQSVSNLAVSAWSSVTNEPIVSGGNYTVTNSTVMPATNSFYRLYKP